jgi:hypothetical protein
LREGKKGLDYHRIKLGTAGENEAADGLFMRKACAVRAG